MNDIIYFELNNWFCGQDYPDDAPFTTWMCPDTDIKFMDEDWVKSNKLCVVFDFVDMSVNFCITATKDWVEKNCPSLLTKYTEFLREPNEAGVIVGRFGHQFLEYNESNFGITEVDLGY